MSKPIRLLIVEDSEDDAKLVVRILGRGGFQVHHERVWSPAAMAAALLRQTWDAVVSDYNMPGFGGLDALRLLRATGPDIPFILISGTVGEEIAVDAMKAGANDYITKNNLSRLASVLERELREAANRAERRRAEIELRKLSLAVRQSGTGIVITDPSGAIEFVNPKFEAMTGYSASEIIGKNPRFLKSGVTPPETYRDLWEKITTGKEWSGDIQNRRKAGELYWEKQRISPVLDDNGRILNFIAVKEDVTEQKRAEQEAQRFRMAMDVSADSIYLTDPASMRFVYLNKTACQRLGYSREQLLEMGPQEVLPMDREQISREYGEVIAAGDRGLIHERPFVRSDGSKGWTELHRRALRTEGGTLIVTIGRDITDRRQAEKKLRDSELQFRQTFELAASGMAHVSLDDRFLRVNRKLCEMLGYQEEDLIRHSVKDFSHPDDRDVSDPHRARVRLREVDSANFEKRYLRKDGAVLWASVTVAPARDAAAELDYEIAVFEDITERKAQQEKIEHLSRVYAVLSGINALIVRVRDREELFREACRVAVEAGGFRMAWLGVVDREAMQVKPVAWHGDGANYVQLMRLRIGDEGTAGLGLSGQAVAERRAIAIDDMARDPRISLRKKALERGFHSLAMLPLLVGGEAVGVLALYAGEVGFFDDQEMKLLQELAGDIGFALDHIEKAQKLDYLAYYDSLTGLANRTLFHERLGQYARAAQQRDGKLALVLANVERFKAINDSLGRQAGDELLKQLAGRLGRATLPANIARLGADYFAIVLPEIKGRSEIGRTVERIWRDCFTPPFRLGDTELRVSAKAGIALFPNDGSDADTLFANAEAALQKAQETGERYQFHTRELTAGVAEELALENRLRQALEKDEFVLHYQPKVDLLSRRIVGLEALLRWQSPELGLVPPMKFIPLMEETGLILPVGSWALKRASLDHRRWVNQGLMAPRVAVNVSPIQLRQRDFVGAVEQAIIEGVAPTGIDLEITESLVMANVQDNIEKLKAVRGLGMSIAIDDFGTGYSSLGYLAKLPVQTLKIDRSFIITMLNDPDTMMLVQTIISLAHSLRLKVVAEGVDSEDQAKFLRLLRCDEMQGYLISRPVPFDQMTALLTQEAKG